MRTHAYATLFVILMAAIPALPADGGEAAPGTGVAATVEVGGLVAKPLVVDAKLMGELERRTVTFEAHGSKATYEGVSLEALLERAGVPFGEALRGKNMTLYVLVGARDGYQAVLSITELAPAFGGTFVLLADRRDGSALSDEEGPYRLIVSGDQRPARSVRQVTSLTVQSAADR